MIDAVSRDCDASCEARQACVVCHRRKAPLGRSVAAEMAGGLCDHDCGGYYKDPKPGHLWPGELERDREER